MQIDQPLILEYENFLQCFLSKQCFAGNYLYFEIHKPLLKLVDFPLLTKFNNNLVNKKYLPYFIE